MVFSATNNIIKGECFCGEISFEVGNYPSELYQCHCSECRKTTGSSANAGFLVAKNTFRWLAGKGNYQTFVKDSGYRVNFCTTCGSPVPNVTSMHNNVMWVPAGLLEDSSVLRVSQHIFVGSKAHWDVIVEGAEIHSELPVDIKTLFPAEATKPVNNE